MPARDWEAFDLSVAAKVIQHISSGIYRTPGGAVKELVSNSFDAGASFVSIQTNPPRHQSMVVTDDGRGMDEALIRRSFSHIGASVKTDDSGLYMAKGDRPMIGRFGIGMLAAAHISHKILITTYPKDLDHGLECELDLEPFFELEKELKTLSEVALGTVRFREITRAGHSPGTIVTLPDIAKDSNFYRTITRVGKRQFVASWPKSGARVRDDGKRMAAFVRAIHEAGLGTIERMTGRERLLWELGLITPVKYLAGGPVNPTYLRSKAKTIVESLVAEAEKNSFEVFFDGIEVRKPILLPTPKARESYVDREDPSLSENVTVFPIELKETRQGVSARGYLVHQPNVVHPREIQGLYPRVRGVGVGQYESTLFRTLQGEQPIIKVRVSGEIYIEGIDDAINLDRSGFNELNQGFQSLLDGLESVLGEPGAVLTQVKRLTDEHSDRVYQVKEQYRAREAQTEVQKKIRRAGLDLKVESRSLTQSERKLGIRYPFVTINDESGSVTIDPEESDPRLAQVIILVDRFLAELPEGDRLRRDLAEKLRELFRVA